MSHPPAGLTSNYTYDAIYQLTQTVQGLNTTETYGYDAVGNRLSSLGVSPYSYNSSNELTATPNAGFTYDNNGNTTSKTDSNGTTGYTWDFENRLASVTLPGNGGSVDFQYDPFGRRIQKIAGAGTSVYAYDGDKVVEELDAGGMPVAHYSQGLEIDEPLAMSRSSVNSFYEADGLGSVTSLSDGSGQVAASYTYDSFGNVTNSTGSLANPFRYTGREFDSETGLYYYRARYYDPSVGRFLSEDPTRFRSGPDFYPYVHNRPTVLRDPTGQLAWGSGVGVAGMIGALMTGGGGDVSCMVVGDTQGNSGLLCCGGVGGGVVEGGSVSVQAVSVVCPNCRTICDMEGGFVQVQGFGGLAETGAGGAGVSVSNTSITVVASGGGGVGAGAGVVVLGGDCKLKLGGKKCKKCPSQK